jgi:hypothetical protein
VLLTWTTDGEDLGSVEVTDSLGNVLSTAESATDFRVTDGKCRGYTLTMTCSSGTTTEICTYDNTDNHTGSWTACLCVDGASETTPKSCPTAHVTVSGSATNLGGLSCETGEEMCHDFTGTYILECGESITICVKRRLCQDGSTLRWRWSVAFLKIDYSVGTGGCYAAGPWVKVTFGYDQDGPSPGSLTEPAQWDVVTGCDPTASAGGYGGSYELCITEGFGNNSGQTTVPRCDGVNFYYCPATGTGTGDLSSTGSFISGDCGGTSTFSANYSDYRGLSFAVTLY